MTTTFTINGVSTSGEKFVVTQTVTHEIAEERPGLAEQIAVSLLRGGVRIKHPERVEIFPPTGIAKLDVAFDEAKVQVPTAAAPKKRTHPKVPNIPGLVRIK